MYIKWYIKKQNKELVENIEKQFNYDLYKIGDFFKNLKWKTYEQLLNDRTSRLNISKENYEKLQKSFPKDLIKIYDEINEKRNNLAHANSGISFKDIENDISKLLFKYESLAIKTRVVWSFKPITRLIKSRFLFSI